MTRYTSIGFKRTHVEAGFDEEVKEGPPQDIQPPTPSSEPPAKKRKRVRRPKPKLATLENAENVDETPRDQTVTKQAKGKNAVKRHNDRLSRKDASEQRRQKRIQDRNALTICFACREKGHAVRDCPNTSPEDRASTSTPAGAGICYRCGSQRHSLSRCPKPPPQEDQPQLPFATCFVCKGIGHLVSACPENREKGIYPNGGSCKLCGETSHLAKDCGLRRSDAQQNSLLVGSGKDAGADEDDFHIISRKRKEVDVEESLIDEDGVQFKPKPRGKVKSLVGGKFHVRVSDEAEVKRKPAIPAPAAPRVKTVVF